MKVLTFLLFTLIGSIESIGAFDGECRTLTGKGHKLSMSVERKLNESDGSWGTGFYAKKVDTEESAPGDVTLYASHLKTECDGKTVIIVEAFVKDVAPGHNKSSNPIKHDNLLFHPRHGHNAVILDNGRTVQKLDLEDQHNAVVFTNRPLRKNELFEVRLEKRTTKNNHCLGIGIMTHSPDKVEILSQMYTHSNGTWMYHNNAIYQQGKLQLGNYGRDINQLQVRERVGVMRRDNGELHFFVNGVDQGTAATNIPENPYGILELWNDAVKGTIVGDRVGVMRSFAGNIHYVVNEVDGGPAASNVPHAVYGLLELRQNAAMASLVDNS